MTDLLFQPGVSPAEAGLEPPQYVTEVVDGMRIERDVAITLSDGVRIYANVYRPEGVDTVPALLAWGPYGKHNTGPEQYQFMADENGVRGAGVDPEWLSPYTGFEGPDPVAWTKAGYAVVTVDPRATWWSEGEIKFVYGEEARDAAEVVDWAGTQPWSNGKVGMAGVSYLAIMQWATAAMQPKHLAAINPCEGLSDPYREFILHGGIPDTGFPRFWQANRLKFSLGKVEAIADMAGTHPLDDEYWESKRPALEQIEVPAYVIASWSDQGLHTRGTLEAFERIGSNEKFLEVHGRKKWEYFHQPSTFQRQLAFFDKYLKGEEGTEVDSWPLVRYELRTSFYEGIDKTAAAWPIPGRELRTLHLDAAAGELVGSAPTSGAEVSYEAAEDGGDATFEHVFEEQTDLVGSAGLHVWITVDEGADDADLFVVLKKLDADGKPVDLAFANALEKGPVAMGWLRASHRDLDPELSAPDRPFHTHRVETALVPGEPTLAEIELWPSATRFEKGERLQLVIRGSDHYSTGMYSLHKELRNNGSHTVSTGGDHDSTLVFGVVGA